jgi:hypothetical protein
MARWVLTAVQLTAPMVAGTTPILAKESCALGCGTRRLLSVNSRSAGAIELFFLTGGVAGQGMPIPAGGTRDFSSCNPFDGELYVVGGTVGEYVVLHTT